MDRNNTKLEFPLQFHLGMGHSNFTINWNEYSTCVPNKENKQSKAWFQVVLVPVNVDSNQEEWTRKQQDFTTDYNYTFSKLDSTYAYKAVVSLQSATNRDRNLKLTTNRTAACLDDYYYLLCVSRKPFGDICHYQTVDWYHGTVRIVNSSKYIISEPSATERVLKFLITEDEFREPQNFFCKAITCMSNVVSVGRYGVPLPPIIENVTMGTTWINLTWYHNESCCTNGKYILLWQQWQSDEASDNMNGSRMVNPADHNLTITPLNPGTKYIVTVSVECQRHGLQNATECITTTASGAIAGGAVIMGLVAIISTGATIAVLE